MKANRLFIKTNNKKIEYIQDSILTCCFYILRIFPIQSNKIVVTCFKNRGFCDSPKYIVLNLLKKDVPLDIVWLCDEEASYEMPSEVRQVPYHSFRGIYEQVTAGIWISNRRRSRYVRKRPQQYYIQTWHGGIGLKNTERAAQDKLTKRYVQGAQNDSKMINLFLSNSDFSTKIIQNNMWYTGEILQKGLPRSDVLLNGNKNYITQKVKKFLDIPFENSILLYAPTFRADMDVKEYIFPYEKALKTMEEITGKPWTMIIHMHTNVKYDNYYPGNSRHVINASTYEDVQELLIASNILVSDYSSIIFDFAMLNKPVLRFCPDLEAYMADRGFNQNIHDLPFFTAFTPEEVITAIGNIILAPGINLYKWMTEKYGLSETGHAAESVSEIILKKISGGDKL